MGHQEIDIRTTTSADPAAVWSLLSDSASWPSWTPIEHFELVAAGGSDGLGEVRTFTTGRVMVREESVERKQEKRLSYELLGGLAVRDYRAKARGATTECPPHALTRHASAPGGRDQRTRKRNATGAPARPVAAGATVSL